MKDCGDCYWMGTNENKDGKFACGNRKSSYDYVSARQEKCNYFGEAFYSSRSNSKRDELRKISKQHGYYIMTVLSKMIDIPEDNIYMQHFIYLRDVIMESDNKYDKYIEKYELVGPLIAKKIKEYNNVDFCRYLYSEYLDEFLLHMLNDQYDNAINVYFKMIDTIIEQFDINKEYKLLKRY